MDDTMINQTNVMSIINQKGNNSPLFENTVAYYVNNVVVSHLDDSIYITLDAHFPLQKHTDVSDTLPTFIMFSYTQSFATDVSINDVADDFEKFAMSCIERFVVPIAALMQRLR